MGYHRHPPSRERCFQVVSSSQESLAVASAGNDAFGAGLQLPDHWDNGFGVTALLQNADLHAMPPVPPSSEAVDDDRLGALSRSLPVPTPPAVMPDEFDDLPLD